MGSRVNNSRGIITFDCTVLTFIQVPFKWSFEEEDMFDQGNPGPNFLFCTLFVKMFAKTLLVLSAYYLFWCIIWGVVFFY